MLSVCHLHTAIQCPAHVAYDFVLDPANLPKWASGLAQSSIEIDGPDWRVDSPMGRILIRFAERNAFGVLDHDVTLATGQVFHNPLRVIPNGTGCDVVFTLFRQASMTDAEFEADRATIEKDLRTLKGLLEAR